MKAALILLVAGFSIKAGVVPFHGWVPGAYSSAPPAVSVMLAGIVTKAGGVYAIIRMMQDVFDGPNLNLGLPFMVLGAVSIVVGALAAIGQKDMKKMLAWSSISQIGYIILGAGLGTPLAHSGRAAALLQPRHVQITAVRKRRRSGRTNRHARHGQAGRPGLQDENHRRNLRGGLPVHRRRAAAFGLLEQAAHHHRAVVRRAHASTPPWRCWPAC